MLEVGAIAAAAALAITIVAIAAVAAKVEAAAYANRTRGAGEHVVRKEPFLTIKSMLRSTPAA